MWRQNTAKPIFMTYLAGKQTGDIIEGVEGPKIEAQTKDICEQIE